jgi:cobalt/nickel transport system ATP-binding protein
MEPQVMILDEPTSNLDPASSEEIMDMLDELNQGGKTLIISTHDVDLAYRWADEIILMRDGEVVRRGNGPEVFMDPDLIRDARLKLPLVVDIYQELASRGIVSEGQPPRNIIELCDFLQPPGKTRAETMGKIYICDAEGADEMQIRAIVDKIDNICFKGAMGTSAKLLAERCQIPMDFTYGVIDKCILKALIGKDALIITSGGMVEHTVKRISDYRRESGSEIEVIRLLPS